MIKLMGCSVEGLVVKYTAETEAQARQAFSLGAEIAGKARAPFSVLAPILEIQHPSGGAVLFRWRELEEGGEVVE
ncbi:hypothetical protein PXK18_01190 [Phaeobacter gallaeciensis]|nr:hypothetical protein [Phaeobacter gallaeciensis]